MPILGSLAEPGAERQGPERQRQRQPVRQVVRRSGNFLFRFIRFLHLLGNLGSGGRIGRRRSRRQKELATGMALADCGIGGKPLAVCISPKPVSIVSRM